MCVRVLSFVIIIIIIIIIPCLLFTAEAVVTFDYEATQDDELTLKEGQIITNINMMEEGWWEGELNGQRGLFPDNFVEVRTNLLNFIEM